MIHLCTFIYDNGGACNSAAVRGRNLCAAHLHHRARLMRIAQVRARNERFDLRLPPLESMPTVLSALNHIVEAVAADMLDLKRADFLLKSLRFAAQALKNSDAGASPTSSAATNDRACPELVEGAADVNLTAQYGLPNDLDLNLSPEAAFPPPAQVSSDLSSRAEPPALGGAVERPAFDSSSRAQAAASAGGVERPAFSGNWQPATGYCSPMPTVAYCDHGPGCPEHTIRADFPITPESIELREVFETGGETALVARHKQQQRNHRRRQVAVGRKRYAAIALEKNMRLAAERLAERKLAERAAQPVADEGGGCPVQGREAALGGSGTHTSAVRPVGGDAATAAVGCPIPPSFGGVGLSSSDQNFVTRKPVASTTSETIATKEEATA